MNKKIYFTVSASKQSKSAAILNGNGPIVEKMGSDTVGAKIEYINGAHILTIFPQFVGGGADY